MDAQTFGHGSGSLEDFAPEYLFASASQSTPSTRTVTLPRVKAGHSLYRTLSSRLFDKRHTQACLWWWLVILSVKSSWWDVALPIAAWDGTQAKNIQNESLVLLFVCGVSGVKTSTRLAFFNMIV
jgi:hypothetical protein